MREMLVSPWSDIRQGIRQLASARAFSVPAVSGLALAIAATTAVFSVLNATMLHSLGFTGNDRIVAIWSTETKQGQQQVEACYDDLVHWRAKNGIFESVAIASSVNLDTPLLGEGPPQQVDGTTVSGSFFRVLGARAARGRLIEDKDDVPNAPIRVVISHRLWETRFGGAPDIGRDARYGREMTPLR